MRQGIFHFSKKLWTPRRFSWAPLTALRSPRVCYPFSGEESWGWSGPRAGPGLWLSCPAPGRSLLSLPCPSPPSCSCSPCSPRAVSAAHPTPLLPLPTEEVARCPLPGTEDKNNQWKNTWLQVKH